MTSQSISAATSIPAQSGTPGVRLLLPPAPPRNARATFDGAWWPRNENLRDQAVELAERVGSAWHGRVVRITFDPTIWAATPRRIARDGAPLRMGWFASPDPQELTLVLLDGRRVELLVVPPGTSTDQAEWAMARAIEPGSVLHAKAILRLAVPPEDGAGRWDDEGGHQ